jgi:hypothetical protein
MLMFYFIHSFLITGLFARSVSLMLMFYFTPNTPSKQPSNEKTVNKIKHQHQTNAPSKQPSNEKTVNKIKHQH